MPGAPRKRGASPNIIIKGPLAQVTTFIVIIIKEAPGTSHNLCFYCFCARFYGVLMAEQQAGPPAQVKHKGLWKRGF